MSSNKKIDIDKFLQSHLGSQEGSVPSKECLNAHDFMEWALGDATGDQIHQWSTHCSDCRPCSEKIGLVKNLLEQELPELRPPAKILRRVRNHIMRRIFIKKVSWKQLRRPLGFIGFIIFFALSIVVPQYFLQMLVVAVLCGVYGIFENRPKEVHINVTHKTDTKKDSDADWGHRRRSFDTESSQEERHS